MTGSNANPTGQTGKAGPRGSSADMPTALGANVSIGLLDWTRTRISCGCPQRLILRNGGPASAKRFDEVPPNLHQHLHVGISGSNQVVALEFATDRAPYVVKNYSGDGPFDREVPWRVGTKTRSAHHSELLLMLAPVAASPLPEIRRAAVSLKWENDHFVMRAELQFLLLPFDVRHSLLLASDIQARVRMLEGCDDDVPHSEFLLPRVSFHRTASDTGLAVYQLGSHQLHVTGPGLATLTASGETRNFEASQSPQDFIPRTECMKYRSACCSPARLSPGGLSRKRWHRIERRPPASGHGLDERKSRS